jgi:hypothetical protein
MTTTAAADPGRSPYHVLLIGIERYASGAALGCCVNDIDAIQQLVRERLKVPDRRIRRLAAPIDDAVPRPVEIPSGDPTRAGLIDAFRELATRKGEDAVQPGDRVLIYYSGHGAQRFVESAAGGARYYREALVPRDHRVEDGKDQRFLWDWELSALLAPIVAITPAVTVVLDCCNSAGAFRALPEPGTRNLPPQPGEPPIAAPQGVGVLGAEAPSGLSAGAAQAMVVAACLDSETAQEDVPAGVGKHGKLTRALLDQLQSLPPGADLSDLRWGQIWRAVMNRVEALNALQHPWLSSNPARRVFGGAPEGGDVGYGVTFDAETATYRIDAGELMDVTKGARVAVYDPVGAGGVATLPPLNSDADRAARRGVLKVVGARMSTATATPDPAGALALQSGARGRLIQVGEQAKLAVALSEPHPDIAAAIARSGLVRLAGAGEKPRMTMVRRGDGAWAMTDEFYGSGEDASRPALGLLPAALASDRVAAQRLVEHYHDWSAPVRLAERCVDLPHCLRLTLLAGADLGQTSEDKLADPPVAELYPGARPAYDLAAGIYDSKRDERLSEGELFCVRLENSGPEDLWVTLLYCENGGRVSLHGSRLLVGKQRTDALGQPRNGRNTAYLWGKSGQAFSPVLSRANAVGMDRMVAIGTTNKSATLDHLKVTTSFADAIERDQPPPPPPLEQWTSDTVLLRLHT